MKGLMLMDISLASIQYAINVMIRKMNNSEKILKPAVFMHIQKTAGTSIVNLARDWYGVDNVISHGDHLEGYSDFPLKDKFFTHERTKDQFGHVPFISGHFGYDFAIPFIKDRYTFTFLRDPVERVLSFYYFCRTRDPNEFKIYKLVQEVSLDEFLQMGLDLPEVKACIWNTQAWQLAHGYGNSNGRNILRFTPEEILELAIKHLEDFSYIGFAETFEIDRDHILKALGIIPPKGKIVSNSNPGRPTVKDLPPATLKLLGELTYLDQSLYKEAWARRKLIFENTSENGNQTKNPSFGMTLR